MLIVGLSVSGLAQGTGSGNPVRLTNQQLHL